jgi:phosphate uptake regulator
MVEFRKLISFGKTSFVMSIPKSWIQKNGLEKGNLISVEEKEGHLVLMPHNEGEEDSHRKTIDIDITGIDRTSIIYVIRSAYKMGYDDIKLIYGHPLAKHFRISKNEKVISVVHEEVNRLVGIEVVQQKENFCMIKDLSEPSSAEFDSALRRVFLLINDASKDLIEAIKTNDRVLLETIEEKHDSITKFVSYCLRLINKGKYQDYKKGLILYHVISNLDKITDVLKYSARNLMKLKGKLKKDTIKILEYILKSIPDYYALFYKFDFRKSSSLYENRDFCLREVLDSTAKIPSPELLIIEKTSAILELITDISEARMALEYN